MMQPIDVCAAALDREFPGWESRIDLDRLDMQSSNYCILGQLHENRRDYGWTNTVTRLVGWDLEVIVNNLSSPCTMFSGHANGDKWKAYITARRAVNAVEHQSRADTYTEVSVPMLV